MDYTVIDTKDGRQEKVTLGDTLVVNKIDQADIKTDKDISTVEFDAKLAVIKDELVVDDKKLAEHKVIGTVIESKKGPKITIQKFKNKVRYHVRKGHRQDLLVLKVTQIGSEIWKETK